MHYDGCLVLFILILQGASNSELDAAKQFCLVRAIVDFITLSGFHTMTDQTLARYCAHRQNISRYRSLLQTSLTTLERCFIERRIAEEEAAVSALAFEALPFGAAGAA
jgi:hypothetical protein